LLLFRLSSARRLPGFELTSTFMIDQKGKKRKTLNLSESLSKLGLLINDATVMEGAQEIMYGSTKRRFERCLYNVCIEI
jgi:hypothetical protein